MSDKNNNKVLIEAQLSLQPLSESRKKEIASRLELPENDQKDLLYMSAILVSTGTNSNGATFLGSELVKAKDSINNKPLNIEHQSDKVIGHISSRLYMDYNGGVLNEGELYSSLTSDDKEASVKTVVELDKMDMDIGIICVVYKDSFPEIADEIQDGDWKISMECYYDDFDLKIGNLIVTKKNIKSYKTEDVSTKAAIEDVIEGKQVSSFNVSRVLRGIRFCGCGIVKNPAEKRAVVLEAANYIKKTVDREFNKELNSVELKEAAEELDVPNSPLSEDSVDNEVVQFGCDGYAIFKNGLLDCDPYTDNYNDAVKEVVKRASKNTDSYYVIASFDSKVKSRKRVRINESSDACIYRTKAGSGEIQEIINIGESKEAANAGINIRKWGPKDNPAGICISFCKYKYEYPDRTNPGKIISTNWCNLYNKPCPVLGADALDPTCLRHSLGKAYETELDKVANNFDEIDKRSPDQLREYYLNMAPPVNDTAPMDNHKRIEVPSGEELNTASEELSARKDNNTQNKKDFEKISLFKTLSSVSKAERMSLLSEQFGLREKRAYPLHTASLVKETMGLYSELAHNLDSFIDKRELYNNIIINALKLGVDTNEFEEQIELFKFRSGKDYSEDYGIPRLKLFPLQSREQVIAAMSRYSKLKEQITDREKEMLAINILRAAAKFSIDTSRFRSKLKNEDI